MKRVVISLIIILVVIAIGIGLYEVFHKKPNPNELILYGNVDVRQVDMGFRVAGQVKQLCFEEGDFVCKGTLLATLDPSPYNNQVSQSQANIESIKANLKNAEILLQRRTQAVAVGGVSQEDVDNALASRNEWQANLNSAEASLATAKDNLDYTSIYAPTDSIILSRIREPGSVVNVAEPVYTLSVISPVWVRAYVDETHLGSIYYGMKAEIFTDSGNQYEGHVGFISPVAEFTPKTVETAQLRTDLVYRLRIYANNPDRYLKQGMPVTVKLYINPEERQHEHPSS